MAVNDATVDLLAAMNLKPYVIQQQALQQIGSNTWDVYRQFDTLDDAKVALQQLEPFRKIRYRIAEAHSFVKYEPVM